MQQQLLTSRNFPLTSPPYPAVRLQASFMSYVFGGPTQYEGRDLGAAHRKLIREKGMTERHFHLVAGGWGLGTEGRGHGAWAMGVHVWEARGHLGSGHSSLGGELSRCWQPPIHRPSLRPEQGVVLSTNTTPHASFWEPGAALTILSLFQPPRRASTLESMSSLSPRCCPSHSADLIGWLHCTILGPFLPGAVRRVKAPR